MPKRSRNYGSLPATVHDVEPPYLSTTAEETASAATRMIRLPQAYVEADPLLGGEEEAVITISNSQKTKKDFVPTRRKACVVIAITCFILLMGTFVFSSSAAQSRFSNYKDVDMDASFGLLLQKTAASTGTRSSSSTSSYSSPSMLRSTATPSSSTNANSRPTDKIKAFFQAWQEGRCNDISSLTSSDFQYQITAIGSDDDEPVILNVDDFAQSFCPQIGGHFVMQFEKEPNSNMGPQFGALRAFGSSYLYKEDNVNDGGPCLVPFYVTLVTQLNEAGQIQIMRQLVHNSDDYEVATDECIKRGYLNGGDRRRHRFLKKKKTKKKKKHEKEDEQEKEKQEEKEKNDNDDDDDDDDDDYVETHTPTTSPTGRPTKSPTRTPTTSPTTESPTLSPTGSPTLLPTTDSPTTSPTDSPTTTSPTESPTTTSPTESPTTTSPTTASPTASPTDSPTTGSPTYPLTDSPTTASPTDSPTTLSPTTSSPTFSPSFSPTDSPTVLPTSNERKTKEIRRQGGGGGLRIEGEHYTKPPHRSTQLKYAGLWELWGAANDDVVGIYDDAVGLPYYPPQQQSSHDSNNIDVARKIMRSFATGNCEEMSSFLSPSFTFSDTLGQIALDATGFVEKCIRNRNSEPFAFHPLVLAAHDGTVTLSGPTLKLLTTPAGEPCPVFASGSILFAFTNRARMGLSFKAEPKLSSLYMMVDEPYFERYRACKTNPPPTNRPTSPPVSIPIWHPAPAPKSNPESSNETSFLPPSISTGSLAGFSPDTTEMVCFGLCLVLLVIILVFIVKCCLGSNGAVDRDPSTIEATNTRTYHMKMHTQEDDSHSMTAALTEDQNGSHEKSPTSRLSEQENGMGRGEMRHERPPGRGNQLSRQNSGVDHWRDELSPHQVPQSISNQRNTDPSFDEERGFGSERRLPPRSSRSFDRDDGIGPMRKLPSRAQSYNRRDNTSGYDRTFPPPPRAQSFRSDQGADRGRRLPPSRSRSFERDPARGRIRRLPPRDQSFDQSFHEEQAVARIRKLPPRDQSFSQDRLTAMRNSAKLPPRLPPRSRSGSFDQDHAVGQIRKLPPRDRSFHDDQSLGPARRFPPRSKSFENMPPREFRRSGSFHSDEDDTVYSLESPSGDMLYNVFPKHIAEALEAGEKIQPECHESVTVFFSDIVNFTDISSSFPPLKVSNMLDRLYLAFDALARKHKVFKVETIGDAWMGVTNLDGSQYETHAKAIAEFAIEAVEAAGTVLVDEDDPSRGFVTIRAGFHSGQVVSNVIGSLNPRFCLFGDTVNVASRMESNSVSGKIQCSDEAAKLLARQAPSIRLTKRGKIGIKGKGEMTTFFVGSAASKERSNDLLYQVFPRHIADALEAGEKVEPESHECVTIFFSDIVHFTDISGSIPPIKVCNMLDRLYMAFDDLARKHSVFKVETIGDAWMGVTNLGGTQEGYHVKAMAEFAIDAVEAAGKILIDEDNPGKGYVKIRAGFHSGQVVSNVVGSLNPRYCLFGDTVNVASRMESNSVSLKIQCSQESAKLLGKQAPSIRLTKRGKINIKGKGDMTTYFVGVTGGGATGGLPVGGPAATVAKERGNEDLLYQVFPRHIADALEAGEKVEPESHECVTIFFSDIVHFTDISGSIPPIKVCNMLDRLYTAFDNLARKHNVFKVETIGDAWMGVTNLDGSQDDSHAKLMAEFAIDAVEAAGKILIDEDNPKQGYVKIRAGFHSGPVVSNVVGSLNPRYCLFGDTVNVASRMESNSVSLKIQCSEAAAKLVGKQAPSIRLTKRGKVSIKGKGDMTTYFVGTSAKERGNEDLLYQVFPRHIADALDAGEKVEPESHESVTIFFSDIVHFTDISSSIPPIKVCNMLDRLYMAFDDLARKHNVFKVETIGDAWMGVTNLDGSQDQTHAKAIAEFALEAVEAAGKTLVDEDNPKHGYVNIRAGFHSGSVVSNVIGSLNPRYCLFGDTVNVASRMESNSVSRKVQCSDASAKLIAQQAPNIRLTKRGKISIKGKGDMTTYFVGAAATQRSNEDLLYQVFPRHIADALDAGEKVEPESHEIVTIFFSDIVHFTDISSSIPPIKVCNMLDRLYIAFDDLARKHNVFKVETIGDAWMGVTNLDGSQDKTHVKAIAEFAIDAVNIAGRTLIDEDNPKHGHIRIRVGFHSGSVVSNVVGSLNPRYCLFGDTVNTASRMESNSVSRKIQCSELSAKLLAKQAPTIKLTKRGKVSIKGKGEMTTYFVGDSNDLMGDESIVPHGSVARRPPQTSPPAFGASTSTRKKPPAFDFPPISSPSEFGTGRATRKAPETPPQLKKMPSLADLEYSSMSPSMRQPVPMSDFSVPARGSRGYPSPALRKRAEGRHMKPAPKLGRRRRGDLLEDVSGPGRAVSSARTRHEAS